jgi:leucyl aminopeptidase
MSLPILCSAARPSELLGDHLLAVFLPPKGKLPVWTRELPYDLRAALEKAAASPSFTGKAGATLVVHSAPGQAILVGTGDGVGGSELLRRTYGALVTAARQHKFAKVAAPLPPGADAAAAAEAATVGAGLANYRFDLYRSETTRDKIPPTIAALTLFDPSAARRRAAVRGIDSGSVIVEAVGRVRDMVNTPANDLNPKTYAEVAAGWCHEAKVKLQVLGPREIERAKMGCVMAVGMGSANEPRFLIANYFGNKRRPKQIDVALIGKGVTFDTGGISIKPWQDMWEMRGDMAGSAVMLAATCAAAKMKLPLNIVTLTPLVENMPSGQAYRPGDILRSLSGQTIEINSTDAEGRLILADALTYAQRFDPGVMVDIATLTGAIKVALGDVYCGIFTDADALARVAEAAAAKSGERVWRMPMHADYDDKLATVVADMRNSAGRDGGACIAAGFLRKFAGGYPWLHIDIAGVDLEPKGHAYCPKGASGFGARLVIDLLRESKLTALRPAKTKGGKRR